ncbi:hypothetical protein ACQKH8_16110, partial [Staphylococcus aureus]
FYNKTWVNIISWTLIIILSILNVYLIVQTFQYQSLLIAL